MTKIYMVTLEVGEGDLRFLARDGMRFALAKSSCRSAPSVVWLAWKPLARNTISWHEIYGVYAARGLDEPNTRLDLSTSVRTVRQRTAYAYTGSTFIESFRDMRIPRRHYEVRNDSLGPCGFGLLQTARLNRERVSSPVNFVVLAPGGAARLAAAGRLHLWVAHHTARKLVGARSIPPISFDLPEPGVPRHYRYDASRGFILLDEADRPLL